MKSRLDEMLKNVQKMSRNVQKKNPENCQKVTAKAPQKSLTCH